MSLDDPQLLQLMLDDLSRAPKIYQPTHYWQKYVERIVSELRSKGLKDYRRRRGSYLATFGATDPGPLWRALLDNRKINNVYTQSIPGLFPVMKALDTLLTDVIGDRLLHGSMVYGLDIDTIVRRAVEKADTLAKKGHAKPLRELESSLVGNPEYVFQAHGRPMTMSVLGYYITYTYAARFTDFDKHQVVVELGSGSGKQCEVIAKLHPNLAYFCFDLPPQLYVAEQYLKNTFGDRVVSFRETRNMTSAPKPVPGKIYMFGNWQKGLMEELDVDLFWNAASLHEMEPNVVENYLASVNKSSKHVFLEAVMTGVHKAADSIDSGVIEPTTLEHYKRYLPALRLIDMEASELPVSGNPNGYSDSFWERAS